LSGLGVGLLQERARYQDRRKITIVTSISTSMGFSVIIVGFVGIYDESVEGDVRGVPVQGETTQKGIGKTT
jgi:Na+-translocating ferredoxin:NAD+ oxidoreductase RnfA subunit